MTRRMESWQDVAIRLGERMAHQANACPAGQTTFDGGNIASVADPELVHRHPHEHVDTCPYCADTVAYWRYLARMRQVAYYPGWTP